MKVTLDSIKKATSRLATENRKFASENNEEHDLDALFADDAGDDAPSALDALKDLSLNDNDKLGDDEQDLDDEDTVLDLGAEKEDEPKDDDKAEDKAEDKPEADNADDEDKPEAEDEPAEVVDDEEGDAEDAEDEPDPEDLEDDEPEDAGDTEVEPADDEEGDVEIEPEEEPEDEVDVEPDEELEDDIEVEPEDELEDDEGDYEDDDELAISDELWADLEDIALDDPEEDEDDIELDLGDFDEEEDEGDEDEEAVNENLLGDALGSIGKGIGGLLKLAGKGALVLIAGLGGSFLFGLPGLLIAVMIAFGLMGGANECKDMSARQISEGIGSDIKNKIKTVIGILKADPKKAKEINDEVLAAKKSGDKQALQAAAAEVKALAGGQQADAEVAEKHGDKNTRGWRKNKKPIREEADRVRVHVNDIVWDLDGSALPDNCTLTLYAPEGDLRDAVRDKLIDRYGFLTKSFDYTVDDTDSPDMRRVAERKIKEASWEGGEDDMVGFDPADYGDDFDEDNLWDGTLDVNQDEIAEFLDSVLGGGYQRNYNRFISWTNWCEKRGLTLTYDNYKDILRTWLCTKYPECMDFVDKMDYFKEIDEAHGSSRARKMKDKYRGDRRRKDFHECGPECDGVECVEEEDDTVELSDLTADQIKQIKDMDPKAREELTSIEDPEERKQTLAMLGIGDEVTEGDDCQCGDGCDCVNGDCNCDPDQTQDIGTASECQKFIKECATYKKSKILRQAARRFAKINEASPRTARAIVNQLDRKFGNKPVKERDFCLAFCRAMQKG